jgi:hypothetical protein
MDQFFFASDSGVSVTKKVRRPLTMEEKLDITRGRGTSTVGSRY